MLHYAEEFRVPGAPLVFGAMTPTVAWAGEFVERRPAGPATPYRTRPPLSWPNAPDGGSRRRCFMIPEYLRQPKPKISGI
jgi:hypothetical protein